MSKQLFSFEFFPPQTPEGVEKLRSVRRMLARHAPEFFSVTFGAGGSTRERTRGDRLIVHGRVQRAEARGKSLEQLDTVAMTELILDRLRRTPNNAGFLRSIVKSAEEDAVGVLSLLNAAVVDYEPSAEAWA